MKESWNQLGFKDRAQYTTAMVMIASGILLAFLSFITIHTIASGTLIYIAQAFTAGGAIFGVSVYFKNQLIEAHGETMNKVKELIEDVVELRKGWYLTIRYQPFSLLWLHY